MKLNFLSSGLLLIPGLLTYATLASTPASAACVMTDVGVQVAIHGSHNPASQTNDVNMGTTGGPCLGNTTTNTATQVYVGSGDVEQNRTSNHVVGGTDNSGMGGPVIGTSVPVQVDVYSPAHDQNFMNSLPVPH